MYACVKKSVPQNTRMNIQHFVHSALIQNFLTHLATRVQIHTQFYNLTQWYKGTVVTHRGTACTQLKKHSQIGLTGKWFAEPKTHTGRSAPRGTANRPSIYTRMQTYIL